MSGHTHSTSSITSGTLPASRGGTGVSSLTALKTALGIGTSSVKIACGTYTGNGDVKTVSVSPITDLLAVHVEVRSGLRYYSTNGSTEGGLAVKGCDAEYPSGRGFLGCRDNGTFIAVCGNQYDFNINYNNATYLYIAFGY